MDEIKMIIPIHLFCDRPMVAEKVIGSLGKLRVSAIGYGENEKLAQQDAISKIVANLGMQIGEPDVDFKGFPTEYRRDEPYKITLIDIGTNKLKVVRALTEWRKRWRPNMTSSGSILKRAKEDVEKGGVIQDGIIKKAADELFAALTAVGAHVYLAEEDDDED